MVNMSPLFDLTSHPSGTLTTSILRSFLSSQSAMVAIKANAINVSLNILLTGTLHTTSNSNKRLNEWMKWNKWWEEPRDCHDVKDDVNNERIFVYFTLKRWDRSFESHRSNADWLAKARDFWWWPTSTYEKKVGKVWRSVWRLIA